MTRKLIVTAALLMMASLASAATAPTSLDFYVNGRMGNDLGSCQTPNNACRTIQAAIDRIPAVLVQNVDVYVAGGTYKEMILLADRLAPTGHVVRLIGDLGNTVIWGDFFQGVGITIRRFPSITLENLTIGGFQDGVEIRLSEVTINNTTISGNHRNGIVAEKSWLTLQAATSGTGVTIQSNMFGSGIKATCGSNIQFEGPAYIALNGVGLTATMSAVIDLNGLAITLANTAGSSNSAPPPAAPLPVVAPVPSQPGPVRTIQAALSAPPACEMVANHMGMIMGYANALVMGSCACQAEDASLCHAGTE